MGIPRLTEGMRPYGSRRYRSSTIDVASSDRTLAVIDGPSLAHHILEISNKTGRPVWSYDELSTSTIAWLDELTSFAFEIQAIYFDGYLQPGKKPIRLDRTRGRIRGQQSHYASSHQIPVAMGEESQLPIPPFLVPAIIERLCSSKYAAITTVEPGEADVFCAQECRSLFHTAPDRQSAIFTSDSDLFIQDLGPQGFVIPLREMDRSNTVNDVVVLEYQEYHPLTIARRLGLPNLRLPAYYLQSGHSTFGESVYLAKKAGLNNLPAEYMAFEREYTTLGDLPVLMKSGTYQMLRPVMSRMDTRISEVVLQIHPVGSTQQAPAIDVWLPILAENPERATAWHVGNPIRQLAYSLLLYIGSSRPKFLEYVRKGQELLPVLMEPLNDADRRTNISAFVTALSSDPESTKGLPEADLWHARALRLILQYERECGKTVPLACELRDLLLRDFRCTCPAVHRRAQIQAALYSFRMLKQILAAVLTWLHGQVTPDENLLCELDLLHQRLRALPGLVALFDPVARRSEKAKAQMMNVAQELLENKDGLWHDEDERDDEEQRLVELETMDLQAEASINARRALAKRSANPFDLLPE